MNAGLKSLASPRASLCGPAAVLFESEGELSLAAQEKIWALGDTVREWPGVEDVQPGMNNLLVLIAPTLLDAKEVAQRLLRAWNFVRPRNRPSQLIEIGVRYGGEGGVDMPALAELHGLSIAEVVRLHSASEYTVFSPGSSPGFGYLYGLNPKLFTPRKQVPVMRASGSFVSIGGAQSALGTPNFHDNPELAPSGWHVIGYAPDAPMPYDFSRERPFLLSPGDRIRFRPEGVET